MDQLFNRNGGKNAEKIFKKVFANEDIVKVSDYRRKTGRYLSVNDMLYLGQPCFSKLISSFNRQTSQ